MSDDIDEHLGKRLWALRRSLDLTLYQVADAIGVSFQLIQKYECGATKMSAARLWALAQVLDVQVGYFYEGFSGACIQHRIKSEHHDEAQP